MSGVHFTKFIEEVQFKAANLTQTRFDGSQDVIPHSAGAYTTKRNIKGRWVGRGELSVTNIECPLCFRAATGVLSTAQDMAHWLLALQEGRLLQDNASLRTLWSSARSTTGRRGASITW